MANYVGHPREDAVAGCIQVQNDPRFRGLATKGYWHSRMTEDVLDRPLIEALERKWRNPTAHLLIRWRTSRAGAGRGTVTRVAVSAIETPRLILRLWRDTDREPFAAMNADPDVMRHFPSVLTSEQSDALFDRIQTHQQQYGFGLLAAEDRQAGTFLGYIGLLVPSFEASFTPCVEIGWRLASAWHGRGLATEGARAVCRHAFCELGLKELVSFTVPANVPSRRVMEKIGMQFAEEFDHPCLPPGHPLRRHVLYRLSAPSGSRLPASPG